MGFRVWLFMEVHRIMTNNMNAGLAKILEDFADNEAGLLPNDLKRGVLSKDGLFNLLERYREKDA